jgi:hypothetical protein
MNSKLFHAIIAGFIGGFISVLIFHQLSYWALSQAGWMNVTVYSTRPIPPFGVPQILSQAFWGGIWGIVFALAVPRLPAPLDGVWGWILLGMIGPPAVAWFVVAPLRHQPLGFGFRMPGLVLTPLVHALFGFGVMLVASLTYKLFNWKQP